MSLSMVKISKGASQTAIAIVKVVWFCFFFTQFRVVNKNIALQLVYLCEMGNILTSDRISGSLSNLKILFQV